MRETEAGPEQAGTSGELTVTLPSGAKFATATPVNLRGEKLGQAIPIESGRMSIQLAAFAPASFLLMPSTPSL